MSRRAYLTIAGLLFVALVLLLIYSLDRTSWLLAQYELSQADTLAAYLGLSPLALGVAAALVIEIGAVALVAGDVLAIRHPEIKRYASAGLAVVLAVQALANLLAGFVRGYQAVLNTLTAHHASADIAWWVAGISWILSSVAVPALIFLLSKLAALTLRLALDIAVAAPSAQPSIARRALEALQERLSGTKGPRVGTDAATAPSASGQALIAELLSLPTEALAPSAREPSAPLATAQAEPAPPSAPLELVGSDRYTCDFCGAPLKNKQAVGAMRTNGFCPACKHERKAA